MYCTSLLPAMFFALAAFNVLYALEPPRTIFDWTPAHVAERTWLTEQEELSANVYVHSPGRGFYLPIPESYCLNSVDLTVSVGTADVLVERIFSTRTSYTGILGKGWHCSLDAFLRTIDASKVEVLLAGVPTTFQRDIRDANRFRPARPSADNLTVQPDGTFRLESGDDVRIFSADGQLLAWTQKGTPFEFTSMTADQRTIRCQGEIVLEMTFDSAHRVTQIKDRIGRSVSYQYNDQARLQRVEHIDGTIEEYQFDDQDRLQQTRFRNGSHLRFTWDESGRLIEIHGPGRLKSLISYESSEFQRDVVITRPIAKPDSTADDSIAMSGVAEAYLSDVQTLFSNVNEQTVQVKPDSPPQFQLTTPARLTYFMTYHAPQNVGNSPGTIALQHESGRIFGPWQTTQRPAMGREKTGIWECHPDDLLLQGSYTVIDSEPGTWGHNSASEGRGISLIRGVPLEKPRLVPAISDDRQWYQHGEGHYRLSLPEGWTVEENHRNTLEDESFDTLVNADRSLLLICGKSHEEVAEPRMALQLYADSKRKEVSQDLTVAPTIRTDWFELGNEQAVRVSYSTPNQRSVIYRVSFVRGGRRYVVNVVLPGDASLINPPDAVRQLFESFEFTPDNTSVREKDNVVDNELASLTVPRCRWRIFDPGLYIETIDFDQNLSMKTFNKQGQLVSCFRPDLAHTEYEYDSLDRLVKQTRVDKSVETYQYDGNSSRLIAVNNGERSVSVNYTPTGQIASFTDALGRRTDYRYNELHQLIAIDQADGESIAFSYDERGELNEARFEDGEIFRFARNELGETIEFGLEEAVEESFQYNHLQQLRSSTDALNQTIDFRYGPGGELISLTSADGKTSRFQYDSAGRPTVMELPGGNSRSTLQYRSDGVPESLTLADGKAYQYEFSTTGRLLNWTDPLGRTFALEYSNVGDLLRMTGPEEQRVSYEYDKGGRVVSERLNNGEVRRFHYDDRGRLIEVSNADNTTSYEYDEFDRLAHVVDTQAGRISRFAYDHRGNLTRVEDSTAGMVRFQYDDQNRLRVIEQPGEPGVEYEYDGSSKLPAVQRSKSGEVVEYHYDRLGRMSQKDSSLNGRTQWKYDSSGRLTSVMSTGRGNREYFYDEIGQLTQLKGAGLDVKYTYDSAGQISAIDISGQRYATYEYDAGGRLISRTDGLGRKRMFAWNVFDQLVGITREDGQTLTHLYDKSGNLTETIQGESSLLKNDPGEHGRPTHTRIGEKNYRYVYDAMGRLLEKRDDDRDASIGYVYGAGDVVASVLLPAENSIQYEYGPGKHLTAVKGPSDARVDIQYDQAGRRQSLGFGAVAQLDYTYLDNGRVSEIRCLKSDGTLIYRAAYEYDDSGRIIRADMGGNNYSYFYDAWGRLVETVFPDGQQQIYRYDQYGNLVQLGNSQRHFDAARQLISTGDGVFTYTPSGQLSRIFDTSGNQQNFEFDALGQLVSISVSEHHKVAFQYDPEGLLVGRSAGNRSTDFLLDRGHIVGKMAEGRLTEIFINGDRPDERLAQIIDGRVYYFITAEDLSILAVINDAGEIVNSYHYSPYGETQVVQEEVPNTFFAKGRLFDADSGLYYYRSRWYHPKLGVFLSPDAFPGTLDAPETLNPYQFLAGDPVNQLDPMGMNGIPLPGSTGFAWLQRGASHLLDSTTALIRLPKPIPQQWLGPGQRSFFSQMDAALKTQWSPPAPTGPQLTPQQASSLQSLRASGFPNRMGLFQRLAPWIGRGLLIYAAGNSLRNVYIAKDRKDQAIREGRTWAYILGGAKAGGMIGSWIGGVGAAPCSLVGGIIGFLSATVVENPSMIFDDVPPGTGENQIYLIQVDGKDGKRRETIFVEIRPTGEQQKMAAIVSIHLPFSAEQRAELKKQLNLDLESKYTFFAQTGEDGHYVIDDERLKQTIEKIYKSFAAMGVAIGIGLGEGMKGGLGGAMLPGAGPDGQKDAVQRKIKDTIAGIRVDVKEAEIWLKPQGEKLTGSILLNVTMEIPGQKTQTIDQHGEFIGQLAKPK